MPSITHNQRRRKDTPNSSSKQTPTGVVYIIHFSEKLSGRAQHYIGFAAQLDRRLREHRSGKGARILNACNKAGIDYAIVKVYTGVTRAFERKLKDRKKTRCICPICQNEWKLF